MTSQRFAARATHAEITTALNALECKIEDLKDEKEFKKKYLALVRKHHPDHGGSEDKMKNITTAYDLLSNLSDFEKKEYTSRNKYSGGSTNPQRNQAYQQRQQYNQASYDFQDMYRRQYESSGMGQQRSTDYSTYQGQTQSNDPFSAWRGAQQTGSGATTGSFTRGFYQARRLPTSIIFFRALVVYSCVVMVVVVAQRASDDYSNNTGWQAAAKQARQDRLEQIFESRQEFMDKLKNRDLQQRMEREKQKEKRVFDYAAQRQAELNRMEFGSFPPLPTDGRMGSVFKIPADPVGILYYEPPMKNSFEGTAWQQQQQPQNNNNIFPPQQNLAPPPYSNKINEQQQLQQQQFANIPNSYQSSSSSSTQPGYSTRKSVPTVVPVNSPSSSEKAQQVEQNKHQQRVDLLKDQVKTERNNNTNNNASDVINSNRRASPTYKDGSDYNPQLDSYGHEGMVAAKRAPSGV